MRRVRARAATAASHVLAEGPVWDDAAARLVWVDIVAGQVLWGGLDDGRVRVDGHHRFDSTAGAAVPTVDGGLLVALRRGFATLSADGVVRAGPTVLPTSGDSRLNDGSCDPAGRFLVGSMALDDREGQELLLRMDGDGTTRTIDTGFTLSNGLAWSPDGGTLYHVDSIPGIVWARDYDVATGDVGPRRVHLQIDDATPDGLCVDVEGRLWLALHGAGEVRCHDPAGGHVATVAVDAPNTTSVAFVGPSLDRLLITTARDGLSAAELAAAPLSGSLFLVDVGAVGLPSTPWAGRCDIITHREPETPCS